MAARAVWEIWSDGVPTRPNQWAQFDAEGRSEWLDLTRVGPYGLQGLSGGTYHLDGQHVTDRSGLLLALGEACSAMAPTTAETWTRCRTT